MKPKVFKLRRHPFDRFGVHSGSWAARASDATGNPLTEFLKIGFASWELALSWALRRRYCNPV